MAVLAGCGSRKIAAAASTEREPKMRIGISGTHGTGKTTLAGALSARLPGHVTVDEPYYLLEEEGHEFGLPPSLEDYRALLACSIRSLSLPRPRVVYDRTPLDYLAYLAVTGTDPVDEAGAAALQPVFASLDLLVITMITPETEQALPAADMPRLRSEANDALLELARDDPLDAWGDIPLLELSGPLDGRLDAVLAALDQTYLPARARARYLTFRLPIPWTALRTRPRSQGQPLRPGAPSFRHGSGSKFPGLHAPWSSRPLRRSASTAA